ncbi:MAG TPA: hypothetical protein VHX16_02040 [Chloroflexota bacterium]|nr:hypothetical protein [Chloroflexota bacterium]
MRRILAASALVVGTVFLAGGLMDQASPGIRTVQAAPSADVGNFRLGAIRFSTDVGETFIPKDPAVEFSSGTDVWVTTEYTGYTGGELTFLARANGEDYAWGKVPNCCQFPEHRIGFKLDHRGEYGVVSPTFAQPGILTALSVLAAPAELPGAAYDVFIYLNNEEVGSAGFGIKGKQGLDNDNT